VTILELDSISVAFGGLQAVDGVSFKMAKGEIVGLIGPNGAGKTTILNVITRVYAPSNGRITYQGEDLLRYRPDQIAALGISRTFQNIEVFSGMAVVDNVLVGAHSSRRAGLASAALRLPGFGVEEAEQRRAALSRLDRLGLSALATAKARDLSYGQQRLLDLARALSARPKLLLLDEPASGFSTREVENLRELLLGVREEFEVTILVVEHVMPMVMALSDRIVVLNYGRRIADGTPREIRSNAEVIQAYLGAD